MSAQMLRALTLRTVERLRMLESGLQRQIVLMRHGLPKVPANLWLAPLEFGDWLDAYDNAEIVIPVLPCSCVNDSRFYVVCSAQRRALNTAKKLGIAPNESSMLFREAELPSPSWRGPKLPAKLWAWVLRKLWMLGVQAAGESFEDANNRSISAYNQLDELAAEQDVLVIGHGLFNQLLFARLCENGWCPRADYVDDYATCNVLIKRI